MRKQKCALSREQTRDILAKGSYGVLALSGNDKPYAVPMNYVLVEDALYLHGAMEGLRYEYVLFNNEACFCVVDHARNRPDLFSTDYASILVNGPIEIVKDERERKKGLLALIERFAPQRLEEGQAYVERAWKDTAVFKLTIRQWSGKARCRP